MKYFTCVIVLNRAIKQDFNSYFIFCSVSFIVIPQSLDQTHVPNNIKIMDFLTGSVSTIITLS